MASTPEPSPRSPSYPPLHPRRNFKIVSGVMEMQTAYRETLPQNHQGGMIQILPPQNPYPLRYPPIPMKILKNPPHMIVNLSKEEWTEVQIYGLQPKK
jgi:hypothetical protein